MAKDVLIGADFGTNGVKLLAFSAAKGKVLASVYRSYPVYVPAPNRAEHDPTDWWNAFVDCVREAKSIGGFEGCDVSAISVSAHTPTLTAMDEKGHLLSRGMIWADARATEERDLIEANLSETLSKVNPAYVRPYHMISKIDWLKKHEKEWYDKTWCFMQCNGYIVYKLTGKCSIDHTMAVNYHYYDVHKQDWDLTICELAGIDMSKLPPLYCCSEVVGQVTPEAAKEAGLDIETVVVAGATDTSAAALGSGAVYGGDVLYSMGTGSSIVSVFDTSNKCFETDPCLICLGHPTAKKMLNVAVMSNTGGSLKWMRDTLCQMEEGAAKLLEKDSFELLSQEAEQSRPGAGGIIYLPYTCGELSPIYNPDARGVFFGLSVMTRKKDMIRAVIEGTCFAFRQNLMIMNKLAGVSKTGEIIATGGPCKSDVWMQTLADISGIKVTLLQNSEGAPMGDIILAGVGAGIFSDQEQTAKRFITKSKSFCPNHANALLYDKLFDLYCKLSEKLQPDFSELAQVYRFL